VWYSGFATSRNDQNEGGLLMTECKTEQYEFHALGNREVVGHFDGGDITTDGGGLLLREVSSGLESFGSLLRVFTDYRMPDS